MYMLLNIGQEFSRRTRDALEADLNDLEGEGWEVVAVFPVTLRTCVFFRDETQYMLLRNAEGGGADTFMNEAADDDSETSDDVSDDLGPATHTDVPAPTAVVEDTYRWCVRADFPLTTRLPGLALHREAASLAKDLEREGWVVIRQGEVVTVYCGTRQEAERRRISLSQRISGAGLDVELTIQEWLPDERRWLDR